MCALAALGKHTGVGVAAWQRPASRSGGLRRPMALLMLFPGQLSLAADWATEARRMGGEKCLPQP